ncbi:oligopeptidase B [soil metagenome]
MRNQLRFLMLLILFAVISTFTFSSAALAQSNGDGAAAPKPPMAGKKSKTLDIHGETRVDDYFWLRDKLNPAVISYLESENAHTAAVMKPTEAFQESLYKELLGRIKQTDTQVPYRQDGYFYYSRTVEGLQYPIYARRKGSMTAVEEITLDLNEMAKGHPYTGLGAYNVSDDSKLLAYSMDYDGHRDYTLYIKDLQTGKELSDQLGKVVYAFWAPDNRTLFYGREDDAKRPHQLWRHTVGDPKEKEVLVAEEKDELYRLYAARTRSRQYILVSSSSSDTNEWSYIPTSSVTAAPKLISARQKGHEYSVDQHRDKFYILTNDKGRNFRLAVAPFSNPGKANWTEVIPHRPAVMLEDIDVFKDFFVLSERENGLPKLRLTDFKSSKAHYLEFPEPVYSAGVSTNREFATQKLRYSYNSFTTPPSTYDYDVIARKSELLKRQEVLGNFDPANYKSERIYATASDGTKIPISLVYKRGVKLDGTAPLWLTAYGSYGIPSNVSFTSNRLSMLDRGVVYALAHIRGGGDLGKPWYDDGKLMKKKNTFTDFIDSADHLVKEKYTSKDRLVISGGSAGGLLMGAVVNMRPDLFKAVVSYVPFVDVINTMLDKSLPLTVQEFLEWGNPENKEEYVYMKSYSPYDNIEAKDYPNTLVRVSLNDSQVPYWEGAKYVAKLRAMKTDNNHLLLKANMGAGHGGASGRYDALKDVAFDYAFMLWQMGIIQ